MKEFKISMDFIDNYILKAKPEYAMVYLYAYRHKDGDNIPSADEISAATGINKSLVEEAAEYWTDLGFDIFNQNKLPPKCDKSRYSAKEITSFFSNDNELAMLYEETEKLLNKPLSSNDQQTLFWIYNDLDMSAPVIILLINYAKSIDKCRMRYIEKMAMEWSEKGIVTYDAAEKHLADIERASNYEARIKKLFGINRNLSSVEKNVIADWCENIKPTKDNLLKAYDICIEQTGKFSARYINAILVNWKNDKKAESKPKTNHIVKTPKATKFNNFTQESNIDYKKFEMEALRKRLSRTGDDIDE